MVKAVLRIAGFIIGIGFIAVPLGMLLVVLFFNRYTSPPKIDSYEPPVTNAANNFSRVSFKTGDGLRLTGWLLAGAETQPAVIVAHGHGASSAGGFDLALRLHRRGLTVLLFDFRGHGKSDGDRSSLGWNERQDVRAALYYLKHKHADRYNGKAGVYGISMGGAAALFSYDRDYNFDFYILEGVYGRLQDSIRRHMRRYVNTDHEWLYRFINTIYHRQNGVWFEEVEPAACMKTTLTKPVLLLYGEEDPLAELGDGVMLQVENPRAMLVKVPRARHQPLYPLAWPAIERFLDDCQPDRVGCQPDRVGCQPARVGCPAGWDEAVTR